MNYKKLIKSGLMSLALLMAVGCDVDSSATNPDPGFAQLDDDRAVSILENSGQAVEIVVLLGGPQSTDTEIELEVTGDSSRYLLSETLFSIPAGETSAVVTFTAVDDDEINGDVSIVVTLSANSDVPVGIAGQGLRKVSKTITIVDDNVPCNDYTITVTTDFWGAETHWYLVNEDGVRVAEGGPYGNGEFGNVNVVDIELEDGCYTFTMWDEFGDGQVSGDGDGSYLVNCGSIVAASGSGAFDTVGFPGATGADLPNGFGFQSAPTPDLVGFVETTDFCVNQ
jgi:hypothetical protein